ncbi:energy-coupling factor transporter transmembrane protein EcfT [Fusibacter sp. 3D3]|uniref:energy-coupling factor transporter transmembrane component T family protein n=1 Tax=Fusibacter sp. 3D3 TaxID=1048380 RepID=UPI000853E234|nr:energy-coupling factor transporter transmembrane component T [Fusibacter sp. 3D3]GAU78905.1 transmembrane component MtsC of energizing module of methionine-regulated ECF transporter [Fusibacter sp. 3D3]
MKIKLFSYNFEDTFVHHLSGLTKIICFLFLTFAVMFSYDIRVIISILLFSLVVFRISKIKFKQVKLMVIYVAVFIITNAVISFLFAPEYGVKLYGTRHEIIAITKSISLTYEQLFFQVTKLFKYASVIPFGIIFLLTTNPSELASALSGVGVNYKAAYAVALTLRYFPDIQREYADISQAQQARGLDLSHKAKFKDRFKNALLIMVPLIFSTLSRVELISNAMDLRGFGKGKKRTWYNMKKLSRNDHLALGISALIFIASLGISFFINHSRYYNPFI